MSSFIHVSFRLSTTVPDVLSRPSCVSSHSDRIFIIINTSTRQGQRLQRLILDSGDDCWQSSPVVLNKSSVSVFVQPPKPKMTLLLLKTKRPFHCVSFAALILPSPTLSRTDRLLPPSRRSADSEASNTSRRPNDAPSLERFGCLNLLRPPCSSVAGDSGAKDSLEDFS